MVALISLDSGFVYCKFITQRVSDSSHISYRVTFLVINYKTVL